MNQPDLGLKIAELRQQKGLTQEKLAEYCEVSTRTIQRIENGDVEPRSFTRNSLSNILAFDFGKENTNNQSLWLALLHLSSVVCADGSGTGPGGGHTGKHFYAATSPADPLPCDLHVLSGCGKHRTRPV